MIRIERQEKILRILEQQKSSTVKELARMLFISEASIRRDIEALEKEGLVKRVYGGVLLSRYQNGVVPVDLRDADHSAVKEEIARRAAELICDGDTVMMDASSTVRRVIKYIGNRRNLKIITNNLRIFSEAAKYGASDWSLYCTGGFYSSENHAFVGAAAEQYLRSVRADCLFFSSQGLSEDGEISDASEEETALRRVMLTRAERRYFLCDSSKLGVRQTFILCHRDELTGVIGDS